jgi:hypothetical protein
MQKSTAKIHRAKTARWGRGGCATGKHSPRLKFCSLFLQSPTKLKVFLVEVRRP